MSKPRPNLDYYLDSGLFVCTRLYLKNRGFCCRAHCRHCPYGLGKNLPDPPNLGENYSPESITPSLGT